MSSLRMVDYSEKLSIVISRVKTLAEIFTIRSSRHGGLTCITRHVSMVWPFLRDELVFAMWYLQFADLKWKVVRYVCTCVRLVQPKDQIESESTRFDEGISRSLCTQKEQ